MRGLLLAVLLVACRPAHPELHSCADPVDGTWQAAGRGYEIVDKGELVEVFTLFDSSRPPEGPKAVLPALPAPPGAPRESTPIYSPLRIEMHRRGETLSGRASYRLTRPSGTCTVSYPVRLAECRGRSAVLSSQAPAAVDERCQASAPAGWTDVPLVRE